MDTYVKIAPGSIYTLRSYMTSGVERIKVWSDCSIQWSSAIEAYGLANGVSFTDLNPDSTN